MEKRSSLVYVPETVFISILAPNWRVVVLLLGVEVMAMLSGLDKAGRDLKLVVSRPTL